MGTEMVVHVAFVNIFMAKIETNMLSQNKIKPRRVCPESYIHDVFSLGCQQKDIDQFIEQAYTYHTTTKFTAEISEKEITLLDTVVYKEERFQKGWILHNEQTYLTPFNIRTIPFVTHQVLKEVL